MPLRTLDSFKLQILPRDGASVPSATAGAREFHIDPLPRTARAHTHRELRVVRNSIRHGFPRTVPVLWGVRSDSVRDAKLTGSFSTL